MAVADRVRKHLARAHVDGAAGGVELLPSDLDDGHRDRLNDGHRQLALGRARPAMAIGERDSACARC